MKFRAITIPTSGPPLIRRLFQIINQRRFSVASLALRSGVQKDTIHGWRGKFSPTLANFEAVLNALGYQLAIVPMAHQSTHVKLPNSEGVPFQ